MRDVELLRRFARFPGYGLLEVLHLRGSRGGTDFRTAPPWSADIGRTPKIGIPAFPCSESIDVNILMFHFRSYPHIVDHSSARRGRVGENSKIEWTNHTFNPWWGCTKVSEACKHCYAEAWAKRVGRNVWGAKAQRRTFSDNHWQQPLRWNTKAQQSKTRQRVFCASMADVFEDREELAPHRVRLARLIDETPWLDWLLLTKRPQNALRLSPWPEEWPTNVWIGTTVELQYRADELLPELARVPAAVRFISAEPLLGNLDIEDWLGSVVHWVITGGESGPKARPASPTWFRSLHGQCMAKGVPFHFKQWGDWAPGDGENLPLIRRRKVVLAEDGTHMVRVGKKIAGRILDGEEWDGLPRASAV